TLNIDVIHDDNGERDSIANGPLPISDNPRVTLTDPGVEFGTTGHFETSGFDAAGNRVFRGATIPLYLNGLSGIVLPLFIGRVGTWSRPSVPLLLPHIHPVLGFSHGYLVAAGGEAYMGQDLTQLDLYDLVQYAPVTMEPAFPRAPQSMVVVQTGALLIDDAGAEWANFYTGLPSDATAPTATDAAGQPFSFGQVAGGDVIANANGDQYVVGATRATAPTNQILVVHSDGTLTAIFLSTARSGAAAAMVRGDLWVVGGTTDGMTGAPIEKPLTATLPDGTPAPPSPYPPDPTSGFALAEGVVPAPPDAGMPDMTAPDGAVSIATAPAAFLVGGVDPTTTTAGGVRSINPDCTMDCAVTSLATLPVLTRTRAFFMPATTTSPQQHLVVIGETSDGEDHAYVMDPLASPVTPTEIAFRERRSSASVALFPNNEVGIVGGLGVTSGTPVTSFELLALP
ncbi:MAG TPA: hypothetical protein VGL13_03590, partial [Polyangiaceae bacterium]